MQNKLFGRTCPICGEIYKECQITKIHIGAGAQINLMCEQGHKWSEFYSLTYRGYWSNNKKYNSNGEEENV